MRLALNLGYMVGGDTPQGQLRLVRHAEALGFDSFWAAEAYGTDVVSVLAWLAGQTERIGVGSAVMQIPGRTPTMTAMTAASMDLLTNGRFRLGLGISGPQVSEGWHGVRFAKPLGRTREYLQIVRRALDRQVVEYDGEHFRLPLPGGQGKALKLMARRITKHVPMYLAAVGPKNLELAGEYADGWLAIFYAPGFAQEQLASVRAGRERARASLEGSAVGVGSNGSAVGVGRNAFDDGDCMDGFDVVATVPLVVGTDVAACADPVRAYAALYVGGMGSREQNFYNRLACRMGFEEAAHKVQELYLSQRQLEAMAEVPVEFIDQTSLLGDEYRLRDRLAAFAESGMTTCAVTPTGRNVEEKCAALDTLARAYARL